MIELIISLILTSGGGTVHLATSYGSPGDRLAGRHLACTGQRVKGAPGGVAHRSLPCGTLVRITYKGRSVVASVVDRGPYWAVPKACAKRYHRTAHRCWLRGWIRVGRRCKKPGKKYKWQHCRPRDWPHANDYDFLPKTTRALQFSGKAKVRARVIWRP